MLFMAALSFFPVPTGGSNLPKRFFLAYISNDFLEMLPLTV
jgi:hypothetical protein